MRITTWATALIIVSLAVPANAGGPLFMRGGQPGSLGEAPPSGPGLTQSCDGSSSVCAGVQNGQTFVTWDDVGKGGASPGPTGANYRYRLYRSTSALDSGNCTSGTLISSYIANNSAQLFGGDPTSGASQGANPFMQSYRQDSTRPMSVLVDLGTPLAPYTGLQVYTAKATENAYYCVVSTTTSDTSPSYIGAVGPMAESVATPSAIKYADSLNRGTSYGKISGTSNLPMVYKGHASGVNSGCNAQACQWGSYYEMFLTTDEGWQDGRPVAFSIYEDVAQNTPSLARSFTVVDRDTIWDPGFTVGGIETLHLGLGLMPNSLVGCSGIKPCNRYYPTGRKQIERILNWNIAHFSADPNQIHWKGHSMGAWGGAVDALRMTTPRFASAWLEYPLWRQDLRGSSVWPGSSWTSVMPFKATVAAAPSTLGSTASSVLMADGSVWGGTGGYMDMPSFIASNPGTDLPATFWSIGKYDTYMPFPRFQDQLDAVAAFQSAHRIHAFCWATMTHEGTDTAQAPIDRDASPTDTAVAYRKDKFSLILPAIAFTASSIDDNPGTNTPTTNGLLDGDYVGCKNAGFTWNVTSDTSGAFNFTVGNLWMGRNPTTLPSTTTTATMAPAGSGSVTVTSTAGWLPTGSNPYALVGNDASPSTQEVVKITGTAGNTITFTSRGLFGTTAQPHASGVTIKQLVTTPTGPNGGPYSTMTTDVTPRRIQGFTKGTTNGQVISCDITPNGGGTTTQTPTVANNIFTLTGVTINATGATAIACS